MITKYIWELMKLSRSVLGVLFGVFGIFGAFGVFDNGAVGAVELDADQKGVISTNCDTIKQSIQQLTRADSKTRVYLGSSYENALTNFIIPLNLRLTKNNKPSAGLTSIQSKFAEKRQVFNDTYTDYMKQVEDLLAIDCRVEPEVFYEQLTKARASRATLQKTTLELNSLLHDHIEGVKKVRSEL